MEILVCTKDWLKEIPSSIIFEEDLKELDKFVKILTTFRIGL